MSLQGPIHYGTRMGPSVNVETPQEVPKRLQLFHNMRKRDACLCIVDLASDGFPRSQDDREAQDGQDRQQPCQVRSPRAPQGAP
eukprot:2748343-Pyramimonas_sp.AAC.3